MKTWQNSKVKLATDALRDAIANKRIALMMNTSAISNDGRSLIDVIASDWKADVAFFFGILFVWKIISEGVSVINTACTVKMLLDAVIIINF